MSEKSNSEEAFYIESNRAARKGKTSKDEMDVESYAGNDWGERLSYTVGLSYIAASSFGLIKGAIEGMPKRLTLPKKLILNNMVNSLGKETSRFGNAAAGASLLYYLMGSTLTLFFEDELSSLSNLQKNVLCGSITGAIFKSTLGVVPTFVGGLVGGGLVGSFTYLTAELNKKGYISFEMKF